MVIKIGHASINERGRASGGSAGDQTGKEVFIRSWYKGNWNVVLRPKKSSLAEKSAKFVEDVCKNSAIGYDQGGRNSLYTQAKKVGFDGTKVTTKCECDCSSFMHVAAIAGGANIPYGTNGATTRTMRSKFAANGDYQVLTDSKYLTSDKYLKRGDILIREGAHTVMALENGSAIPKQEEKKPTPAVTPTVNTNKIDTVREVQSWANSNYKAGLAIDGLYGSKTKKALIKILQTELNQTYKAGLAVDGSFGSKTKAAISNRNLSKGTKNDVVKVLQAFLVCNKIPGVYVDGSYGNITVEAVKTYQKKKGLKVDGIAGKGTFTKLCA